MLARWRWVLHQLTKRLWFRASLFSLLGIATALLAVVFKDYIPESLSARMGADAVDKILGIIASSMLAVTTFSLSTMVSAYGAASSGVTPRATTLVIGSSYDKRAGNLSSAHSPPPSRFLKVREPPRACASCCAIASPRPVPPVLRLREFSTR